MPILHRPRVETKLGMHSWPAHTCKAQNEHERARFVTPGCNLVAVVSGALSRPEIRLGE
jgi:hypothetical protein